MQSEHVSNSNVCISSSKKVMETCRCRQKPLENMFEHAVKGDTGSPLKHFSRRRKDIQRLWESFRWIQEPICFIEHIKGLLTIDPCGMWDKPQVFSSKCEVEIHCWCFEVVKILRTSQLDASDKCSLAEWACWTSDTSAFFHGARLKDRGPKSLWKKNTSDFSLRRIKFWSISSKP